MPLVIPDGASLAGSTLAQVRYLRHRSALRQDARPMRIFFLNLMPQVLETELQILRLLANSPMQIEITLVRSLNSLPNHGGNQQLLDHYRSFDEVRDAHYDAAIIIGSESEVGGGDGPPAWEQFALFLDWTRDHVRSSLHIGWAAQAAVSHFHNLLPRFLPERRIDVIQAAVRPGAHALFGGLDQHLPIPVARAIRYDAAQIDQHPSLSALIVSESFGVHCLQHAATRRLYLFDHLEGSAGMFRRELRRHPPGEGGGVASSRRVPGWRAQAHVLLANWLDAEVYLPMSLSAIAEAPQAGPELMTAPSTLSAAAPTPAPESRAASVVLG